MWQHSVNGPRLSPAASLGTAAPPPAACTAGPRLGTARAGQAALQAWPCAVAGGAGSGAAWPPASAALLGRFSLLALLLAAMQAAGGVGCVSLFPLLASPSIPYTDPKRPSLLAPPAGAAPLALAVQAGGVCASGSPCS